jgi:hypothetical protein
MNETPWHAPVQRGPLVWHLVSAQAARWLAELILPPSCRNTGHWPSNETANRLRKAIVHRFEPHPRHLSAAGAGRTSSAATGPIRRTGFFTYSHLPSPWRLCPANDCRASSRHQVRCWSWSGYTSDRHLAGIGSLRRNRNCGGLKRTGLLAHRNDQRLPFVACLWASLEDHKVLDGLSRDRTGAGGCVPGQRCAVPDQWPE